MEKRPIRKTTSPCPVCKKRLEADIYARGNDLWMDKFCPDHGGFSLTMSRDARFYEQILQIVGPSPTTPDKMKSPSEFDALRGICMDLTQRCNLNCANCFANANANVSLNDDMTAKDVFRIVDQIPGRRPVVFLEGGEPTLNPELPEIIRGLVSRGCVPKLITNGLKISEPGYARTLKDAGLDWIFLQFDGFSEDTYEAFRGKKLLVLKRQVIARLSEMGFSILLAVMVERGYNLGEVGAIIDFAFNTPGIRQISFLPGSKIGRNKLSQNEKRTEPLDIIEQIEKFTAGSVTPKDFLSFFKWTRALYRLTKNPDYKPKTCFFPMVLYRENGRTYPLNRLISPGFAIAHPGALLRTLKMGTHALRPDKAKPSPDILWLCIEHFRELATLDIEDARHCNKAFPDQDGQFVQSCIYNNLYRR